MMIGTRWLEGVSIAMVLIVLVAGCRIAGANGTPTSAPPIHGRADVEEVELLVLESFPVQVVAVARGHLRDGCTEIDSVDTSFDADSNTFSVEVTTVRDSQTACTQALVPFEERIDLEVRDLAAGTYTVDVNGVRETFTLAVDNESPESSPVDVSWEEARELILAGEVAQVAQLHSLEVTLELKDGRQVVTVEPEIDAVFDVVDECGEACEDIVLVTE